MLLLKSLRKIFTRNKHKEQKSPEILLTFQNQKQMAQQLSILKDFSDNLSTTLLGLSVKKGENND